MTAKYNFSAGPALLPRAVIERAREELGDWCDTGHSVMEVSHRSKAFLAVAEAAECDLRALLEIPDSYKVLFLQGGATGQFAAVPLNILGDKGRADYVHTGYWSGKAIQEASRFCEVDIAASGESEGFVDIPSLPQWKLSSQAAYVHYCPNETIHGVEFHWIPDSGSVPLVADMSSTLLSRPLDVSRFGVIYAGAQKNIGPAGLTVVIVRDDLIGRARPGTPAVLDYRLQAEHGSMYNTPPTFAWYLAGLVFRWLLEQGGLEVVGERNRRKAARLYQTIDASGLYRNPVMAEARSWMNVPFKLLDETLQPAFLAEAEAQGLLFLEGHRAMGGMRASLYNAMPEAGVEALVDFLEDFERRHG